MILRRESRVAICSRPAQGVKRMAARNSTKEERKASTRKSGKAEPKKKDKKVKAQQPSTSPPDTAEPKILKGGQGAGVPHESLSYAEMMALLSPDQHRTLEALSQNLARAAVTAQSAIAEAALRQAERPPALSPDPFHVGPALTEVMSKLAAEPDALMRAQADLYARFMELWQTTARRAAGEEIQPAIKPAAGDKRFNDPEWEKQPLFDVMKQSYLLTTDWLNSLIGQVKDVDPMTKRRVEFFMKMLTDAFSPSNFLISNPVALREAIATRGESIAKGMENFAADLERGHGHLSISQTDFQPFKVGENIATAPGKVIFQNDILQLLQFAPAGEQVHEIPLLIFPPWINKWYILDLRVENSMIRWLTGQGFTVFVASWVNPEGETAKKTFEDYLFEGVYAATEQVMAQCGTDRVNTVGYCIGGTLLSCALAHMAVRGDKRIASATFFAAQQD